MTTARIRVRRVGVSAAPWVVVCLRCEGRPRTHATEPGMTSVNNLIGNRSWLSAMQAVRAHLAWHDVRCGECRLGLGVHRTEDPQCVHHDRGGA